MNSKLKSVLSKIGKTLNKNNILWVVGGSIILNHYGIVKEVNDIDIIIDEKDFDKVVLLLKQFGNEKSIGDKLNYHTKKYVKMNIEGVSVDLMAGFIIEHENGLYNYVLDQTAITSSMKIDKNIIPLGAIEDWYVIYQVIGGREKKVKLLENYLNSIKRINSILLTRSLKQQLPINVVNNINNLL